MKPTATTATKATKTAKPAAAKTAKSAKPAAAKPAATTLPKRSAPTQAARTKRLSQPAQPRGVPAAGRPRRPSSTSEPAPSADATPILRTALQAAGELAEIGLVLSGRTLRRAIQRLPRP
jgi:hypothetical protein